MHRKCFLAASFDDGREILWNSYFKNMLQIWNQFLKWKLVQLGVTSLNNQMWNISLEMQLQNVSLQNLIVTEYDITQRMYHEQFVIVT
jgi:hypothetical protein